MVIGSDMLMNCKDCGKRNIKKALYCKYCGYKFSPQDREMAASEGLVALIKNVKKWYNAWTLKTITDSIFFKIVLLIIFIGVSIYNFGKMNGSYNIKILNSDDYEISYNKVNKEYYLVINKIDDDALSVKVNLYIPNRVNNLHLILYGEDGSIIEQEEISSSSDVILTANTSSDNYYIIQDGSDEDNYLKIFVYYEGESEKNEE